MSSAAETTALAEREEYSTELAPTAAEAAAKQEIQAAVILAKRFPRNEDAAFQKLMRSCDRPTFAGDVTYSFPRGNTTVTGPTIYLAREFSRLWGNIRHGCDVVADDDDSRTIRAWAWDLESNVKVTSDVTFKKLIQRVRWVDGNKQSVWLEPDERDLRELTNKHAAIAKRNCLFELLPSDMIEDAVARAQKTLLDKAKKDPDGTRKAVVTAFGSINVQVENLEAFLGHKLDMSSPAELEKLRGIYKSIRDGDATWGEIAAAKAASASKSDTVADKVKPAEEEAAKAPTPDMPPVKPATLKALKRVVKDQEIPDSGVLRILVDLGIRSDTDESPIDLAALSDADALKVINEIESPSRG